jgi:hypothetical protein
MVKNFVGRKKLFENNRTYTSGPMDQKYRTRMKSKVVKDGRLISVIPSWSMYQKV